MLIRRLRYWMESARRSEALREEMELHLAEKAAELQADGMTAERARAEARRRFGNVGLKHEESREIWITRFWSELGQDVRYGCRTMTANKAFSALAVLLLALGIGANTAIYSLMESILLRSLPVADPESLVVLNWHSRPPQEGSREWVHVIHGVQGMAWPGDKGAMVSGMFPYGAFETLREENPERAVREHPAAHGAFSARPRHGQRDVPVRRVRDASRGESRLFDALRILQR